MSNFFSLEIGKRSILTHQTALSITGHNVANANTPGYTRQVADMVTTSPWHAPSMIQSGKAGQLGTGVDIASINRIRDEFIDNQIRHENKSQGYWSAMENTLAKIEVILNEPTEDGLRAVMDKFWESWQDLSLHPESEAVRTVVVQRGMAMAEAFNHTYRQLQELRDDVNSQVGVKVNEVNSIAMQIADLNQQILAVTISGKQPNDLLDKRDLLIDDLSSIAEVKVFNDKSNMVTLQLGDRVLVEGKDYNRLDTVQDNEGMYMIAWEDTGTRVQISGGELRGLLDARGRADNPQELEPSEFKEIIPNMIDQLDILAQTLVTNINQLHQEGYSLNNKTGYPDKTDFFVMPAPHTSWAVSMRVNQDMQDDLKNIATSSSRTWDDDGNRTNFGDGSNALKIAQLKHGLNNPGVDPRIENMTTDDFWRSVCADIGVLSQEAQRVVKNQGVLLNELENKRQSISGVSLDEEITNMIRFQHAYNAAARYITSIDEALEIVINRMGIVGR